MKILIVDDEPLARRRLAAQVADLDLGTVVGEADSGATALRAAAELIPDVVLLDVRMPEMDGLEAARRLRLLPRPPEVIFTTAYDAHALIAFERQAIAYLLKPVRSERLAEALRRVVMLTAGRELLADEHGGGPGRRRHVSAVVGGELRLLPIADVLYFQAERRYVRAVAAGAHLLVDDPLRALEDEFAESFVRIHRSALVQPLHVRRLERAADGNLYVTFAAVPERLLVSRRLLPQVRRRLRGG